jgi:hypothetical protein
VDHRIGRRAAVGMHAGLRQQRIDATSERMRVHIVLPCKLPPFQTAVAISPR